MLKFYNKWHRTIEMKSNKNKGRRKKKTLLTCDSNQPFDCSNKLNPTESPPKTETLFYTCRTPKPPNPYCIPLRNKNQNPKFLKWGTPKTNQRNTLLRSEQEHARNLSWFLSSFSNLTEEGFFLHLIGEERSNFSLRFDLARWLGDWRAYNRRRSEGLEGPIDEKSPIFRIERVSKSDRERESFLYILLQALFNKRREEV